MTHHGCFRVSELECRLTYQDAGQHSNGAPSEALEGLARLIPLAGRERSGQSRLGSGERSCFAELLLLLGRGNGCMQQHCRIRLRIIGVHMIGVVLSCTVNDNTEK